MAEDGICFRTTTRQKKGDGTLYEQEGMCCKAEHQDKIIFSITHLHCCLHDGKQGAKEVGRREDVERV